MIVPREEVKTIGWKSTQAKFLVLKNLVKRKNDASECEFKALPERVGAFFVLRKSKSLLYFRSTK